MNTKPAAWLPITLASLIAAPAVLAADPPEAGAARTEVKTEVKTGAVDKADAQALPPLSITEHKIVLNGKTLRYRATAGYMPQRGEEDGKLKANIFFIAYTLLGEGTGPRRPITFSFNGGPGSSSIWLHMGALGPKRIAMTDDGYPLPPPYKLVDNEASWLDVSDLVFIDPVATGYSRPAPGEDKKQFFGYEEDLKSVGDFIRLYTTRYERWSSPKFIIGESYGGARAAGLSGHLQDRYGLYVNGVILLSPAFDIQAISAVPGNEVALAWELPTMTATAWYHKKLQGDWAKTLPSALRASEQFALREYAPALLQGDELPPADFDRIAQRLSELTGVPVDEVKARRLRINSYVVAEFLFKGQNRILGGYDTRIVGIAGRTGGFSGYDPSYEAVYGGFTAGFYDHVRNGLGFRTDLPYEVLAGVSPWRQPEGGYLNASETLRMAMNKNAHLKAWVVTGHYDSAVPYFSAAQVMRAMSLDPAIRANLTQTSYEGGHMMYTVHTELLKLKRDFAEWVAKALATP